MTVQSLTDMAVTDMSDDPVIDDQVAGVVDDTCQDKLRPLLQNFIDIALMSDDMSAVASALRVLGPYLPRDPDRETAVDSRMLALIDQGLAARSPELAEAIAKSVYDRSRERVDVALPFLPALLSFLDMDLTAIAAPSYYTLMTVAADRPDSLGPFAGTLIGKLAGPGLSASTFAARIVTVLARNRPEYMVDARDALRHLCETCPDGILKAEATNAYRAIQGEVVPDEGSGGCGRDEQVNASEPVTVNPQEIVADPDPTTTPGCPPSGVDSPGSIDSGRLFSIVARLLHIRGEISPQVAGDENLDEVAVGASELARWIEAEFSLAEQPLTPKAAAVTPEEITALSQRKAPANVPQPAATMEPATVPGLPAAAETQLPKTEATDKVNGDQPDCSIDAIEIAAMRDLMVEFESNFSVMAGSILDDIGMGHLKAGRAGEDRKISAKEFVSAFDKLINEKKSETKVLVSDRSESGFDANILVSELKRCINQAQSTPVLVPAPVIPESPVPQAETKTMSEIAPLPVHSQSPKTRRYYTRSGTKKCVKIEVEDDKKGAV